MPSVVWRHTLSVRREVLYYGERGKYSQYFNGRIETRKSTYLKALAGVKFELTVLMHEYGHFLQGKYKGAFYIYSVGIVSSIGYKINLDFRADKEYGIKAYQNLWTEVEANTLAYIYFNSPANWDKTNFPINLDK